MNCQNCGTLNNIGSKFCIKCGKSLNEGQPIQSMPGSSYQEVLNEPINKTLNQNSFQNFDTISQPMNNLSNTSTSGAKVSFMSYFFIILAVILKPFTAFKEELNKFNGFKNSIILSLIISVGATLINLISSMLSVVRVKSFDWTSGGYKINWIWENLKNLDYLKTIGKNFLIYLGIIVAIAVVYYLGSLIIKKQTNETFKKILKRKKMDKANYLLLNTDLSISNIIRIIGYDNTSYFYRTFKEYFGLSPKEYRYMHCK